MAQTPDTHWTAAPAFTFGNEPHLWPQVPQFAASDIRSTHWLPHRLGDGATQLEAHIGAPVVVEQRPVGAAQVVPHFPQLLVPVRLVSHPASGLAEQCAKPEVQALGGT